MQDRDSASLTDERAISRDASLYFPQQPAPPQKDPAASSLYYQQLTRQLAEALGKDVSEINSLLHSRGGPELQGQVDSLLKDGLLSQDLASLVSRIHEPAPTQDSPFDMPHRLGLRRANLPMASAHFRDRSSPRDAASSGGQGSLLGLEGKVRGEVYGLLLGCKQILSPVFLDNLSWSQNQTQKLQDLFDVLCVAKKNGGPESVKLIEAVISSQNQSAEVGRISSSLNPVFDDVLKDNYKLNSKLFHALGETEKLMAENQTLKGKLEKSITEIHNISLSKPDLHLKNKISAVCKRFEVSFEPENFMDALTRVEVLIETQNNNIKGLQASINQPFVAPSTNTQQYYPFSLSTTQHFSSDPGRYSSVPTDSQLRDKLVRVIKGSFYPTTHPADPNDQDLLSISSVFNSLKNRLSISADLSLQSIGQIASEMNERVSQQAVRLETLESQRHKLEGLQEELNRIKSAIQDDLRVQEGYQQNGYQPQATQPLRRAAEAIAEIQREILKATESVRTTTRAVYPNRDQPFGQQLAKEHEGNPLSRQPTISYSTFISSPRYPAQATAASANHQSELPQDRAYVQSPNGTTYVSQSIAFPLQRIQAPETQAAGGPGSLAYVHTSGNHNSPSASGHVVLQQTATQATKVPQALYQPEARRETGSDHGHNYSPPPTRNFAAEAFEGSQTMVRRIVTDSKLRYPLVTPNHQSQSSYVGQPQPASWGSQSLPLAPTTLRYLQPAAQPQQPFAAYSPSQHQQHQYQPSSPKTHHAVDLASARHLGPSVLPPQPASPSSLQGQPLQFPPQASLPDRYVSSVQQATSPVKVSQYIPSIEPEASRPSPISPILQNIRSGPVQNPIQITSSRQPSASVQRIIPAASYQPLQTPAPSTSQWPEAHPHATIVPLYSPQHLSAYQPPAQPVHHVLAGYQPALGGLPAGRYLSETDHLRADRSDSQSRPVAANHVQQPISIYDREQAVRWSTSQFQPRTPAPINNIYVPQPQQPLPDQSAPQPADLHQIISVRSSGHRSQHSQASISLQQREDPFKSPHKEQTHISAQPEGNRTLHVINLSNRDALLNSQTLPAQTGLTLPSYYRGPEEPRTHSFDAAAQLRLEIEELKATSRREADLLLKAIEELKAKNLSLGKDQAALLEKLATSEAEVSSLKREIGQKEELLRSERERTKKLETEHTDLNESLAGLQAQVNAKREYDSVATTESRSLIDGLNEENLRFKKELRDLKAAHQVDLQTLQAERDQLREEKKSLESQLHLLSLSRPEVEELKKKVEALELNNRLVSSVNDSLNEISSKLQLDNESLQGQIKVLLQERAENNNQTVLKANQLQKYEKEAKNIDDHVRHLKQLLAEREKDIEALKQAQSRAASASQQDSDQLRKENARLRKARDELQRALETAQQTSKENEKKLVDSASKAKNQLEAMELIGKYYDESKVDIQKLKGRLAASESKAKSLEDIIKDLTVKHEAKQRELEEASSELEQAIKLIEEKEKAAHSLGLQLKIEKEKVALFDETIHQTEARLSAEVQEKDKLIGLLNREVKRRQHTVDELLSSLSLILFGDTDDQADQERIVQRVVELADADLAVRTPGRPRESANILLKEPSSPQLQADRRREEPPRPQLPAYEAVSSTFNLQDEVNPDRINELLEEIKRVQGAKDHLASVLDDLLKKQDELQQPAAALRPEDLDPQTLKLIEAYRSAKTPSGLASKEGCSPDRDATKHRPQGSQSDLPSDFDIDTLEKEFDEKVFKPISARDRVRELEAENRLLRDALEEARRRTPQRKSSASQRSTPPKPARLEEELAMLQEANRSLQLDLDKAKRDNDQLVESVVKLKAEQKVIQSEIAQFKNSLLVKEVREELDKIRAIEEQISGEDKLAQDIPAENSELIEFLKKAAQETRSLQEKYSEAVNNLNLTLNDMDDTDSPNEEFLEEIKKEHLKAEIRPEEQLRQFNHGLWDAVVTQKKVMNNLQRRIMTLERWSTDRTPGQPASDKLTEEAMSVSPDRQPIEIREVEGATVYPAKKKLKKFTPPQTVAELEETESADEEQSVPDQQTPEVIPHETLVDLLITMVQLIEDLRNLTYEDSKPSSDVLKQVQDRLESFEIIGENGTFDMSLIQKVIQGNKELDSNRFDENVIKEANPEEEEDQESKRLKSSMRQSLAQSQRIKSDTNRTKDMGQKRDTFSDLLESKDKLQAELARKLEDIDFLKQELERSKVEQATLVSSLAAEREDCRKKADLVQSLSLELKEKLSKPAPASKDSKEKSGSERQVRAGLSSALQKKFDLLVKEKESEIQRLQLLVDALTAAKKDPESRSPGEPAAVKRPPSPQESGSAEENGSKPDSRDPRDAQEKPSLPAKAEAGQTSDPSSADPRPSDSSASREGQEQSAIEHLARLLQQKEEEIESLKHHLASLPKPEALASLEEQVRSRDEEVARLAAALKQARSQDALKQKTELTAAERSVKSALTPSLQKKFEESIKTRDAEIQRLSLIIEALSLQREPLPGKPESSPTVNIVAPDAPQTGMSQGIRDAPLAENQPSLLAPDRSQLSVAEVEAIREELKKLQKENLLANNRLAELEAQPPGSAQQKMEARQRPSSEEESQRLLEEATKEVKRLSALLREKENLLAQLQPPTQIRTETNSIVSLPKNPAVLQTLSDQAPEDRASKETASPKTEPLKEFTNKTTDSADAVARSDSIGQDDAQKKRLESAARELREREEEVAKLRAALAAVKAVETGKQKPLLSAEEKSIRAALTPSLQRKLDETIRQREAEMHKQQIVVEGLKNPQLEAKQAELDALRVKVQHLEKALDEAASRRQAEAKTEASEQLAQKPRPIEKDTCTIGLTLIPAFTVSPSSAPVTDPQERSGRMDFTFKSTQLKALEEESGKQNRKEVAEVPLKESKNQTSESKLRSPVAPDHTGPPIAEGSVEADHREPATERQNRPLREDLRRAREGAARRDHEARERARPADEHPRRPSPRLDPQDGAEHEVEIAAEVVSCDQKQRHRDEPDDGGHEEQQDEIETLLSNSNTLTLARL